jgi:hypothetical protein
MARKEFSATTLKGLVLTPTLDSYDDRNHLVSAIVNTHETRYSDDKTKIFIKLIVSNMLENGEIKTIQIDVDMLTFVDYYVKRIPTLTLSIFEMFNYELAQLKTDSLNNQKEAFVLPYRETRVSMPTTYDALNFYLWFIKSSFAHLLANKLDLDDYDVEDPFTEHDWNEPDLHEILFNSLFLANSVGDQTYLDHAKNYLNVDMLEKDQIEMLKKIYL